MAHELGSVGGIKAVKKRKLSDGKTGYVLENGIEVVDTFAEMLLGVDISPEVTTNSWDLCIGRYTN
jgi:hypothetical protein